MSNDVVRSNGRRFLCLEKMEGDVWCILYHRIVINWIVCLSSVVCVYACLYDHASIHLVGVHVNACSHATLHERCAIFSFWICHI